MVTKKKILITGASGFIGSHLTEAAIDAGYEVYAGIRKTSSKQFLRNEAIQFLEMDLSSEEKLTELFNRSFNNHRAFDFIIHNAGITAARNKSDFNRVNFEFTNNLINALIASKTIPQRFVAISSLAVYGPGDPKSTTPIRSDKSPAPISAYGRSKMKAEILLEGIKSFPVQIIEPAAVYGPRDRDFLAYFKMINSRFEPVIGTQEQHLSFVYVKDLANGILRHLSKPIIRKKYLVSDTRVYNKRDLGRIISELYKVRTLRIQVPLSLVLPVSYLTEFIYGMAGRRPFLNPEKIREISSSNWICDSNDFWNDIESFPETNLTEGLRITGEWYRTQGWL
jgi:nucleoside-diphosphate-sugar epimerase